MVDGGKPPPSTIHPKIADFGLAKQVDDADGGQTETGAILGTPSYMAPEQAEGGRRQAGPVTDVYSLGAVLYELLTGRPPFRGVTRLETLHQVVRDEPVAPRRLRPGVPRDLETICLECLQKEPRKRYGSALDLAEDLSHFTAGEPIRARPAGRVEIAWRWCRRRPAQVVLAAALLAALVTGGSLVVWQWRRAVETYRIADELRREAVAREEVAEGLRRQAIEQKEVAEGHRREAVEQKAVAEDSFRLAHEAVKDFITNAGREGLLEAHGLAPLRRELLGKAQTYYRKFLDLRGGDPALRRELAEVSAYLADITRQIGSPEEALAAYRRSLDLFEGLARDDPDSVPLRVQRAILHNHIAGVLDPLGRREEALESLRGALPLLDEARLARPRGLRIQEELGVTHHNIALALAALNRPDEARASFTEARAIQERLVRDHPDVAHYQAKLALTLNNVALQLLGQGRGGEALEAVQKAAELSERLAASGPNNPGWQSSLAGSLCILGDALRSRGRLTESAEVLAKARGILEQLVRARPRFTVYRNQLGLCHSSAGQTDLAAGEAQRALDSFEQARKVFGKLAEEFPQVVDFQARHGQIYSDIADAHGRLKHDDPALRALERGREIAARLVEAYPDRPDLADLLGMTLHNRALPLKRQGHREEARASVREAVEWGRKALDRAPQDARYRHRLAHRYGLLALLECQLDHLDAAVDATEKRLALSPKDPQELYAAARDFALAAAEKGTPEPRRRCADLALGLLRRATEAGFRDAEAARKDPALESLRKREEFQKLLADMSAAPARGIARPPESHPK
jgi:tetratricopeptide (TPR) repeat protein